MRKRLVVLVLFLSLLLLGLTATAYAAVPTAATGLVVTRNPDTGAWVANWNTPVGATEIWLGVGDGVLPDAPPKVGEQPVWDAYLLSPDTTDMVLSLNPGIRDYNIAVWGVNADGTSSPARTVVRLRAPQAATNFTVNMTPSPDDTYDFSWNNPDWASNVVFGMTDPVATIPAEPPLDGSVSFQLSVFDGSTSSYRGLALGRHLYVVWRANENGWSAPTTLDVYFPHIRPPSAAVGLTWVYDSSTSKWKLAWADNNNSGETTGVVVAISDGFIPALPTQVGVGTDGSMGYFLEQNLVDGNLAIPTSFLVPFEPQYAWHDYRATVWLRNDAGTSSPVSTVLSIPAPTDPIGLVATYNPVNKQVVASWATSDQLATETIVAVSITAPVSGSSPPTNATKLPPEQKSLNLTLVPGTWYVSVWRGNRTGFSGLVSVPVTVPKVVPNEIQSVYRFYNKRTGTHFYTASADERAAVNAKWPTIFNDEGVAYTINTANPANNQPLYRFYNVRTGSHFYTASADERAAVNAKWPTIFHDEGVAYRVSTTPGGTSVYRFYNMRTGSHFYTASVAERDAVNAKWPTIFHYEGVAFYLAP